MRFAIPRKMSVIAAALAVMATMAVGSATASASVPASWVGGGSGYENRHPAPWSGSLTLKLNGAQPFACTAVSEPKVYNSGTTGEVTTPVGALVAECEKFEYLTGLPAGFASWEKTTGYTIQMSFGAPNQVFWSPYGEYEPNQFTVPYVNSTGAGVSSTIIFKETKIGHDVFGRSITATGTVKVSNGAGGTWTLTHA